MDNNSGQTSDFEAFFNTTIENAKAKITTDTRPISDAILQTVDGKVHLTNMQGRVLEAPVWDEFPILMGTGLFLHGTDVWTIAGDCHTDWIQGELVIMINNWICQRINDELWLSYIYARGSEYVQGDNMRISEFGYADLTRAIVRTDKGWQKVIYIDGFYQFEQFSLFSTTKNELHHMQLHGALPKLIKEIKESWGEVNQVEPAAVSQTSLYDRMTAIYFAIVNGCLRGSTVHTVGAMCNADLQVVFGVKNCIGRRTKFYNK